MLKKLFKKTNYISLNNVNSELRINKPSIPDGMYIKCKKCLEMVYSDDLEKNSYICPNCGNHFRLTPIERIDNIADNDSFIEMFEELESINPLNFDGYNKKIEKNKNKSERTEAVLVGTCEIDNAKVAIGVMDSSFMMGSMGSVVGERITLITEYATKNRLPLIIFTASGGARMQEGIFSLMQMAKTSMAINKHSRKGNLYISILTDPTTGGVTASFAMLGDIIIAEPGALIGFAGPRVIEQTIRQKLPQGFQRSEFLLEHGFIDKIIEREKLKKNISLILSIHREDSLDYA
ncbi:acetyl-CoA carboxylase, carboxyltransferase subunit beta [Helicovermis profundi]|uniref:Acetyl-coenzyme A carboxylase carboxyl transferase subunit beta n=1 Tax=Helicovermis profundi TaxID=3065157 RepID=A0AAU9EVM9_9FIRM|nr:acetyl-CoA carboxylase, carboxyltransferase subunit beta [Clostridia bacterium S502]